MKILITLLLPIFMCYSCKNTPQLITENTANEDTTKTIVKPAYKVQTYQYDSLTIPSFFKKLINNHIKDFRILDTLEFREFCSMHNIDSTNVTNIKKIYTIKILHDLFTSQTAADYSKGNILDIPYLWHWIEPNPRYEIYFSSNNTLLKDTKPPKEFSKYNSYADIDRTPYLYLSELLHPELKYGSNTGGSFSTFGWCSEREMAFIALTKLLGYQGKVVAEGNHSWSEFIVPLKLTTGEIQNFKVTVDNTFDAIEWSTIELQEITTWKKYFGNTKQANWYNRKAKSRTELSNIENYIVTKKAMSRIENKMVNYLNDRINEE